MTAIIDPFGSGQELDVPEDPVPGRDVSPPERDIRVPNPKPAGLGFWSDEPVRIHFCRGCGKVSQAQRKPKYHRRFMPALVDDGVEGHPGDLTGAERAERLGYQVLEIREPNYSADPYADEDYGGAIIACGPFTTWIARPEVDAPSETAA